MAVEQKTLKEIIALEYGKCAADPAHFMKKYCAIQHPTRGKVFFNLFPFQEETLFQFIKHRYNIILKCRQMGISTLVAAYCLWKMLFVSDFNILIIATKQDVAKNLVTKVRVMYEGLPRWLKPDDKTPENNKLSLVLSNGSQIKAVSSNTDAGRSEALSLLIIDEAAFVPRVEKIWAAAQLTLATGGDAILLSTPNGVGNFFHLKWQEAVENGNMNPISLHWTRHPERDQKWRDEQTKLLGEKLAAQECDCDFMASGHTVIDSEIIQWYKATYCKPPIEKRGFDGNLWIWEYPDYTKDYIVCADVARGDGSDWSTCHVIDVETLTQVAEYKGRLGTTDFGNLLVAVASEYNDALLAVENANIGWAVVQQIINRKYKNLYYSIKDDHIIDDVARMRKGTDLLDNSNLVPGFSNTTKTRPLIISKLELYMRERTPIINSDRLVDEMLTFIWNGSKPEALSGYNDDLILAFSIGLWIRDTALRLRQVGIELTKRKLANIYKPVYTPAKTLPRGWEWGSGKNRESLKWLL